MKMESWLLYTLLSMVSFGIYNFLLKVSVDGRFGVGLSPTTSVLSISFAIFVSTLFYSIYTKTLHVPSKAGILLFLLFIGVTWTAGTLGSAMALQKGNASQIVPILNANALIVVALSMLFLGEAATTGLQHLLKVLGGTILILAGICLLA